MREYVMHQDTKFFLLLHYLSPLNRIKGKNPTMFFIRRFDPEIHHRGSQRLRGYDYSAPGRYFITVCAIERNDFFGTVQHGKMVLNRFGQIVEQKWFDLPNHNRNITLDAFVVMPDHIHGIIVIHDGPVGAGLEPAPCDGREHHMHGAGLKPAPTSVGGNHGLPEIVRQLKTFSARRINELRGTPRKPVWQRNYYDSIIHNEQNLNRVRCYIMHNPANYIR